MRLLSSRWSFAIAIGLAIVIALVGSSYGIDRAILLTLGALIGLLWSYFDYRANPPRIIGTFVDYDAGKWERLLDQEYRLDIVGATIALFHNGSKVSEFEWSGVTEVQMLGRPGTFPSLFWRIISRNGEFQLPMGGSYSREFENLFIKALPDYRSQRSVSVRAPTGFQKATSLWRKVDPFPKLDRSAHEDELEI